MHSFMCVHPRKLCIPDLTRSLSVNGIMGQPFNSHPAKSGWINNDLVAVETALSG